MAEDEQKIKFEQYRDYTASAEKNSDRRGECMKLFVKLNSVYLVFIGVAFGLLDDRRRFAALLLVCIVGLLSAGLFALKLFSYKRLNSAKYQVIQEMEQDLPFSSYTDEWNVLGGGKDKRKYVPVSHIDVIIAVVIGVAYLMAILGLMFFHIRIAVNFVS